MATATRQEALHHQSIADIGLGNHESIGVESVIVLGIGHCALEGLLDRPRDALARERELGERLVHLLAADHLGNEVQLLRAGAQQAENGFRFVVLERALGLRLAHVTSSWPSCRPNARSRYGSVRTRRTCGRSSLPRL